MGRTCRECGREFSSYKGYANHHKATHDGHPLLTLVGRDRLDAMYQSMSENALADELDVSRTAVQGALESAGIERRGRSEAEHKKWSEMTEEERQEQVQAAHETTRDMVEDGGHAFQRLWREKPEEMQARAKQAAGLGAAAREENGMAGVTGQDHPGWRGGKSVYDAVKKLLGDESWATTRNRIRDQAGGGCEMCGRPAVEIEHRDLDVHHIVPLLCGGTNEDWNLLALCDSCHHRAEWYTRDRLEPALVK